MSDVSAQPQNIAMQDDSVQSVPQSDVVMQDAPPMQNSVMQDVSAAHTQTTVQNVQSTPTATHAPDPSTVTDAAISASLMQTMQSFDPLNPSHPVGKSGVGAKETTASQSLDAIVAEVPGAQTVELEKSAEVPPEVESWIEKVQHHEIQAPHEVVVADQTTQQPTGSYASEPVIVLPVTQQGMQTGLTKAVTESARWLVTWCGRIIKKFHGMVVYRDVPQKRQDA